MSREKVAVGFSLAVPFVLPRRTVRWLLRTFGFRGGGGGRGYSEWGVTRGCGEDLGCARRCGLVVVIYSVYMTGI